MLDTIHMFHQIFDLFTIFVGPVPAGQSDSEIEKSWQAYKKVHNIQ